MDVAVKFIPTEADNWKVTRAIAAVLHSEDFAPVEVEGRLLNFRVKLNDNPAGGIRNDGTGILTLPTEEIGHKFLSYVSRDPIKIDKRKLKFYKQKRPPQPGLAETLKKTPYINPDIEEARELKLWKLDAKFRVDAVQFGIFYQPKYPSSAKDPLSPRAFSVEWERQYIKDSIAWLRFDYDHKLIRVKLGSELTEQGGYSIVINFASLQKVGVGYDGKPYICFDTLTPPIMEKIQFHRSMTGDKEVDNRKFKQRVGSIHEGHSTVAPYAPHLRIVLYNDPNSDVIGDFVKMCDTAGLAQSMIIHCRDPYQIEALRQGFFGSKRLYELHKALGKFDWPVAFQLESLLRNGLLHTGDLDELLLRIRDLTGNRAKRSSLFLPPRKSYEMLRRVLDKFEFSNPSKTFRCYHITFTPTRTILEGPYASQSNRVIRQYPGFEDHFIRVDFRDEDRLQYRWDREVDGTPFLIERVGTTLKVGFDLAGRRFEFLAYSSSALREHAVWFMNPFYHPEKGRVIDAGLIRDSLGDLRDSEWEEQPDLGDKPYEFTDGVGTISKTLGDRIWKKLCETKRNPVNAIQPSAYQIRFLGYKGVVVVDEQLDKRGDGIHMRLRPSMRKFEAKKDDIQIAPIEIAQAFEQPNTCYLNRPLVMLLEDVGVRRDAFQTLQDAAVADAKTIDDSISHFCNVLSSHRLGSSYRLKEIMGRLQDHYNMELTSNGGKIAIDSPFLQQIRQVAMTDVLRDIKHSARIPVPNSYLLVGVADEGPAYSGEPGYENVYCLGVGEIYACIQKPQDKEPTWLEGNVSISRSPVVHPGDVQRVRAIGKPPEGQLCLFGHLKNVVVMPSVGHRSLASCLGGGDVDGDLFSVICYDSLLPRSLEEPALYEGLPTKDLQRDSSVEDICDFVVEYINSDILGLLSDRLLVIADQSSLGMHDENCIQLAELCSQAVDYPKQGTPPEIEGNQLPRTLIRCKPDWHAAEVVSPRQTDYYESSKALGFLFRSIKLDEPKPVLPENLPPIQALSDPISVALIEKVRLYLGSSAFVEGHSSDLLKIFRRYTDELRYICATHTLSNTPGVRLLEAEVVVGTILAKCSQKRWRTDRMYRMRLHAETLVQDVQRSLLENSEADSMPELIQGLELAWNAWDLSLRHGNEFGANSFGFIALGSIFDCLDKLGHQSAV
ncbi:RNA dependent RNA polymerase-domain-containing protein [Flammula alnicola]|nr:RNA dependent RNA polymerase-domain-containing protein [Flammula alnicola]